MLARPEDMANQDRPSRNGLVSRSPRFASPVGIFSGMTAAWLQRVLDYQRLNPDADEMLVTAAELEELRELFDKQWGTKPSPGERLTVWGMLMRVGEERT